MITQLRRALAQQRAMRALRRRSPDLRIAEGVVIRGADRLTVGKRCFLDVRAYLNCGSIAGSQGFITLGDNAEIGPYCVLWGQGGITIGNNVHIGSHVSITAHEGRQVRPEQLDALKPLDFEVQPVVIEDHVLICSGTMIIPGVRIGHHAMIGAGAVVTTDIPPYALAVGVPARPIRFSNTDPLPEITIRKGFVEA